MMTDFVIEREGPVGIFGVFEDEGDTGYLYIYCPGGQGITHDLHIYNRASSLNVSESDVEVVWSQDLSKCGVKIFNGMRGIIDLKNKKSKSSMFCKNDDPPFDDPIWLLGFE